MSGISDFDRPMTDEELASEMREPPRRPAQRDRQADAAAWRNHIDAAIKRSERETMKAAMAAVGQVLREERDEHRMAISELRGLVAALERRCEALEEDRRSRTGEEERQPRSPIRLAIERGAA
jgi:hypothetical protein